MNEDTLYAHTKEVLEATEEHNLDALIEDHGVETSAKTAKGKIKAILEAGVRFEKEGQELEIENNNAEETQESAQIEATTTGKTYKGVEIVREQEHYLSGRKQPYMKLWLANGETHLVETKVYKEEVK